MQSDWDRFNELHFRDEALGFALDVSRMRFRPGFLETMARPMAAAFAAMRELEGGSIANQDEQRMVGHYWLRAPELAPTPELYDEIRSTGQAIREFAALVHSGQVAPPSGGRFTHLLSIGIGGSALGPQLLADALGRVDQPLQPVFLDNTDPDGFDRAWDRLGADLPRTLTLVMSKSGGTKETRNGMLEAQAAYRGAGLEFARHAIAVTGAGSQLDRLAESEGWLRRFPMWDWVGGRTSVFSAVGLVPAALLGFDTAALLRGASEMDVATRVEDVRRNPAALLALGWYHAADARAAKAMVVLPYRDRLELFARYLQQLVMESLGKELDLEGRVVHQGLVVYGNKGTTDQHAYVQQLREGPNNFFATFIDVLKDRPGEELEVEPGVTSGDYLHGFLLGTRQALWENDRESVTITLDAFDAAALGRLIALFDRAVGYYASLVGVNAYHQPGVEAGKKAAERVIAIQTAVVGCLRRWSEDHTAEEWAEAAGHPGDVETVYHILRHLSANPGCGVRRTAGARPADDRFQASREEAQQHQ
jgi:glucose-6-phosphate isomerase